MSKALENLDKASAWLKSFANPDHISHIGLYGDEPRILFAEFKHFQAAFPAHPCEIEDSQYSETYRVTIDGIVFWSTRSKEMGAYKPRRNATGFVPCVVSS